MDKQNATDMLEKANKLQEQIDELESFLFTINPIQGRDERNGVFISVRNRVEVSLIGSRYYGCHAPRERQLKVTQKTVEMIKDASAAELKELKRELAGLFGDCDG